jgi:hypothetical protein
MHSVAGGTRRKFDLKLSISLSKHDYCLLLYAEEIHSSLSCGVVLAILVVRLLQAMQVHYLTYDATSISFVALCM